MANRVRVNISVDEELKKEASELFATFGLDLSTAISLFLSQSVREGKIPFEIRTVKVKTPEEKQENASPDDYMKFLND